MHGPKPRSHAIKLNKKVRRLGLKIALSARAAEGKASIHLSLSCHCKIGCTSIFWQFNVNMLYNNPQRIFHHSPMIFPAL